MIDAREQASAFHAAHRDRLVGSLTLYTGDPDTAAELVDEAMLRAFQRWERVAGMDAPAAWVWRVAVNLARSRHRRTAVARRAWSRLVGDLRHEPPPTADPPRDARIRRAVVDLPDRQREALVLRHYLELSVAETAARMDASEDAVRSLTKRAVAALRDEFLPQHAQEDADA